MITARYIESEEEVRLYKDNGDYWPIKFDDKELAYRFVKFINTVVKEKE